jgi:hypothetical protein
MLDSTIESLVSGAAHRRQDRQAIYGSQKQETAWRPSTKPASPKTLGQVVQKLTDGTDPRSNFPKKGRHQMFSESDQERQELEAKHQRLSARLKEAGRQAWEEAKARKAAGIPPTPRFSFQEKIVPIRRATNSSN